MILTTALILVRERIDGDAVIGSLYDGGFWICNTMENLKTLVPTGNHHVYLSQSPKFNRVLPLIFSDTIKPSRGIRIHAGNRPSDSAGCVLVGVMKGTIFTMSREYERKIVELLYARELKNAQGFIITSLLPEAIPA